MQEMWQVDEGPAWRRPFVFPTLARATRPGLWELVGASWRQENLLGSFLAQENLPARTDWDFDAFPHVPAELRKPEFARFYAQADSLEDVEAVTRQIRREMADRETLSRGGWTGLAVNLVVGGVLDPLNLAVPGPALYRAGTKGGQFLLNALKVGGYTAGSITATELGLHATQATRTPEESLAAIGGGTILGGLLGGAVSMLGVKEFDRVGKSVKQDLLTIRGGKVPRELLDKGKQMTVREALDEALRVGMIDQGTYRQAVQLAELDPNLDRNTMIELAAAARKTTEKIAAEQGKAGYIAGETITEGMDTGFAWTTIRLYRGADADTVVEEWFHRYWDQNLTVEERRLYEAYHKASGDPRPAHEHYAQEGRDVFYSEKAHEAAGPIRSLFAKARKTLLELIGRIRKIRGQQVPEKIMDVYRRAWMPVERAGEARAPGKITGKAEDLFRGEDLRMELEAKSKSEIVRLAKAAGIPVGKRGRKELVELLVEKEVGGKWPALEEEIPLTEGMPPQPAPKPVEKPAPKPMEQPAEKPAEPVEEKPTEPAAAAETPPAEAEEVIGEDPIAAEVMGLIDQYVERVEQTGKGEAIRRLRQEGMSIEDIAEQVETAPSWVLAMLAKEGDPGEDVAQGLFDWYAWVEKEMGPADEAAGRTSVGYQIREGEPETPEAIRAVVSTFPGLESGFRTPLGVTFREALRFQADVLRRIMDRAGKIRLLKELGIDHRVYVSAGTWDVIEPNLLLQFPGSDLEKATQAGALLADGLGQDAFVTAKVHPEGEMLGYEFKMEGRVSVKDLELIRQSVNPKGERSGYQFTRSPDGKGVRFLYFGDIEGEKNWARELTRRMNESGLKFNRQTFRQDGGYYESASYRGIIEGTGDTHGGPGRPDLQGRLSSLVRAPYIQEIQRRGWEFDPLQYARSRGWSDAEAREILGDFFPPETHSYQIKETLERLDPTLDQGSRMAPIRGLPKNISESILRFIEHVHPGARPFFARYSPLPGQLAEQMVMTWERLVKNFSGRSTAESAEIIKRRGMARYMQKAERIVYTQYVNALRKGHGEGPVEEATFGQVLKAKMNWRSLQEFKRAMGMAMAEMEAGGDAAQFAPEVRAAARELGAMILELGNRAKKAGQLTGAEIEAGLQEGKVHYMRVWKHEMVRRYRNAVRQILQEQMPTAKPEEIDAALNSISGSPTGSMGYYDLSEAQDITQVDTWKSKFFERRELQVDFRKLVGVSARDRKGNPITIDFLEMDALKSFERYVDSVMGSIVLGERFGDVTMQKQFKELWDHYDGVLRQQARDADTAPILQERDAVFKDLLALRDMLNGTYARSHGWDPAGKAMRVSRALMQVNAMLYLGGVVLSSLADVGRPLFHWGLEYYAPLLRDYAQVFRTEAFQQMRKEMKEAWGAALSAFSHERMFALADVVSDERTLSPVERGIKFLSDQMGLLTGMDAWNASLKEISGFMASHAVMDIAHKVRRAVDQGAALNMDALAGVAPRRHLVHIASMGLSLEDLVAISRQVEKYGENYGPLILTRTDRWDDLALRSRFESAMVKEIDSTIITPSIGDKPLWTHWGILQHAAQFKSFGLAGMRGVMIQGLQDMDIQTLEGILASTAVGTGVYYLKQLESGREPSDNLGEVLLNAVDKAGLTAYLMDLDSMIHRVSQGTFGAQSWITGEGATRFSAKSTSDIVFGPSVGTAENLSRFTFRTIPHFMTGNLVQGDETPGFRLFPYGKVPYMRFLMERLREGAREGLPQVEREAQ